MFIWFLRWKIVKLSTLTGWCIWINYKFMCPTAYWKWKLAHDYIRISECEPLPGSHSRSKFPWTMKTHIIMFTLYGKLLQMCPKMNAKSPLRGENQDGHPVPKYKSNWMESFIFVNHLSRPFIWEIWRNLIFSHPLTMKVNVYRGQL